MGIQEPFDNKAKVAVRKYDSAYSLEQKQQLYRFQKKYDLLEKSLRSQYERVVKKNDFCDRRDVAVKLADFYSYGFINYENALHFYDIAGSSAHFCREQRASTQGHSLPDGRGNPEKTALYIEKRKNRILRILGENRPLATANQTGFQRSPREIVFLKTKQYANALQIAPDDADPKEFDAYTSALIHQADLFFRQCSDLSEKEQRFYKHYNIARGLLSHFNIDTLSTARIRVVLEHIQAAFTLSPDLITTSRTAYLNQGLALCLSKTGNHAAAITAFEKFQENINTIDNIASEYDHYLRDRKTAALSKGLLKTAAFLAADVAAAHQALSLGWGYIKPLSPMALSELAEQYGPLQRRLNVIGESDYSKRINLILNMDEQLQLFEAMGTSYARCGRLKKSIFFNKEAVNIINHLRSTIASEDRRIGFAEYKDSIYDELIEELVKDGDVQEAFYYSEGARARALVDLLGSRSNITFADKKIGRYVDAVRNSQIYRDYLRKDIGISDGQVQYLNTLQSRILKKRGLNLVARESHSKTGESVDDLRKLNSLISVSLLKTDEIRALIPEKSTLIEYYVAGNNVYAWILDRTHIRCHVLNLSPGRLDSQIQAFRAWIKRPLRSPASDVEPAASHVLFNSLFSSLEPGLKSKNLYIVGHRSLHFIPFEALYDGRRYLAEKYTFAYLPSASLLQFLKSPDPDFTRLAAFGNPETGNLTNLPTLEGAEKEVTRIGKLFPSKKIFVKRRATETAFRKEAGRNKILHIACHGYYDPVDPLNSRLFFAQDHKNDGVLTARELYGIRMLSHLTTLSACDTGIAALKNGDELVGFIRGFFYAGVSSLVASLWEVDDLATEHLMVTFYRHLVGDKKTIAQALHDAKIEMIQKYPHPYYWAGFVVYGMGK